MTDGARLTRAEAAAQSMREDILNGRVLSGERLVELNIAQALDVSQNTVREALHILEQEGWVVKHARRGVYVRSFTPDDAAELCALIEVVETLALKWALPRLDKIGIAILRDRLTAAHKAADSDDPVGAFSQLIAFHEQIGTAANREVTAHLLESLLNQVRLLEALRQARAPRVAQELSTQIKAHEALYRAIAHREIDAACACLSDLIALYSAATISALRM